MELIDQFRYQVGAYYGIRSMDEYDLKVYILKDIEDYIKNFLEQNPISNINYQEEARKVEEEVPLITKLQDSLLILPKIDAPIELILLVKKKIKTIKEDNDTLSF